MTSRISNCRLCKGRALTLIVNLGVHSITGVFSKISQAIIPKAPLDLYKCEECHLVQIGHNLDPEGFYGDTYGYRSGLNKTMICHLKERAERLKQYLPDNPFIVDIGSNDGTFLSNFSEEKTSLLGIDPVAKKFKDFYPKHIEVKTEMFRKELLDGRKASLITSISMLYDLQDPVHFAEQIADSLTDDGVWFFEQSYLPKMMSQLSYDTICHEHLEYYSLVQLKEIAERAGMRLIDVELNDCNGGSIAITAARKESKYPDSIAQIYVVEKERKLGLHTLDPYIEFAQKIEIHKIELRSLLTDLKEKEQLVFGYGASTKGNTLLQVCGITYDLLPVIAEVNTDKVGSFTPGSNILIIDEQTAHALKPDYFMVLPWHFKDGICQKEKKFLDDGGRFIFPLPHSPSLVQS